MTNRNQKGFVLMESLIVSVFVMALFTVLYTSVFPLIGQYESREHYDDIDSKYTAHWVRKMVLDYGNDTIKNVTNYLDITDCQNMIDMTYCLVLKNQFNISKMYVTTYNLENVKESLMNITYIKDSPEFTNYLDYLPDFTKDINKQSYLRVIVEIDHDDYKTYGTIEVMR